MADETRPSGDFFAITPSDSTDEARAFRAIYVGGAGDIVAINDQDQPITFAGALAGSIIPIKSKRVNSTSTTASSLVALV